MSKQLRWLGLGLTLGLGVVLTGCKAFAALGILAAPRQMQDPEYELTQERLAVVIENARPGEENPIFSRELHRQLVEILRDKNINANVVPFEELMRLRQENSDYARWSLQKIGRAVQARELLYIRLESLRVRAPDHPLVEPAVRLRLKVIAVDDLSDEALLWPGREERAGREVVWERQPQPIADAATADVETGKLARETAYQVAMPFYEVDLEEPPYRER